MGLSEFEFIKDYLLKTNHRPEDVVHGIGDDCAVLKVPPGDELAVSMDTLVNGVHFPVTTSAYDIGHKSLAVGLSDLAAMGARPAWVMLALTLPELEPIWLKSFCEGFFSLASQYNVQLVGGDVTQGPLSITTQLHGFVKAGTAITRAGAKTGDRIYVSGTIGGAGLGLLLQQNKLKLPQQCLEFSQQWLKQLNRPNPRVELGLAIREVASAAIDISDGLAADLQHVLDASSVGAIVNLENVPLPDGLSMVIEQVSGWQQILSGGDDFEICFTVAAQNEAKLLELCNKIECPITLIGEIQAHTGLRLSLQQQPVTIEKLGYEHFAQCNSHTVNRID